MLKVNLCVLYFFPALLDALTKNGSSASNGAYRRRPAESSESPGAQPERESQESGGGESSKSFTKEQVEGVQRWGSKYLLGPVFQPVFVYYQWSCNLSYRNFIHDCSVVYTLLSPWEPPELGFMPICGESKRHLESWTRYQITTTWSNFRPRDRTTERRGDSPGIISVASCQWQLEFTYRISLLLIIMQSYQWITLPVAPWCFYAEPFGKASVG